MRAATIVDGRIEVADRPDPEPQDGQLLVRVRAAGLNGADILQVAGHYPPPPGVPEVFTTAHDAVFTQARLQLGERLLVHGAAGGVGMAAVQLGTMAGARVTATVRDEHAREQISALGVHAIAPEGFEEEGPFDVILELVGAPNLPGDLQALAMRGRIVVIGISAGAKAEIDLRILMGKRGSIHASTLRARSLEDKAQAARAVERCVLPGFGAGDLSVPVTATFPLDDAAAAYDRFKQGGKLGKIVLEV